MSIYDASDISIESNTYLDDVMDTMEVFEDLELIEMDSEYRTDLVGATMVCCQLNPEYLKDVVTEYIEYTPKTFYKGS